MTSNTKKRKKEKIHKDGKIAIIGSGPGALSTALALQQDGFQHVVVYERDEHFHSRKDGYGLTLTYNPSKTSPLTQLGLLEKLARLDCPSRAHYVFDSEGNVLGYFGNRFSKSSRGYGQRGNLRVPRQVLRQVMMNTLKEREDVHNNRIRIEWNKKLIDFTTSENAPFQTTLNFEDGTSTTADLLVGADGVHSTVMKQILSENEQCTAYLGVMIVLGITQDFYHPLLDERGFYTLDGNHRLFTMPYEGSRMTDLMEKGIALNDQSTNINRTRRYMWQLSYNLPYEEAVKISKEGAQSLLREVLRRTEHWHDPVQTMIQSTPLDTVWGTPLMDRSPSEILVKMNEVYKSSKQKKHMRAIALGDAMHAMSPFKGQGCNQALLDGPLLSSWLSKSSMDSAITGFMREMIQRTSKKVNASREAASFLHSSDVLSHVDDFAGVKKHEAPNVIKILKERKIGAHLGSELDGRIEAVIDELGVSEDLTSQTIPEKDQIIQLALDLSRRGDLANIRKLSLEWPAVMRLARDDKTGETCLHLAAKAKCIDTCKWLIAEASVDYKVLDNNNRSPLHSAVVGGDIKVIELFAKLCNSETSCWGPDISGNTPLDLVKLLTIDKDGIHQLLYNQCSSK